MSAQVTKTISDVVKAIQDGRVVAFPTATSYGLAADALQGNAVQRVRNLKRRPQDKALTVCMKESLYEKFFTISDKEQELLKKYQGQSITLLLTPQKALSYLADPTNGKVGLRFVDHTVMQELVDSLEVPITATSANISGEPACFTPECIQKTFSPIVHIENDPTQGTTYDLSLAYIWYDLALPESEPSTIISVEDNDIKIIRQGGYKI